MSDIPHHNPFNDSGDSARDERVHRFMYLYTAHSRRIYGYILCFVPHWADAEDLLQEISAVMWSKFDQFEPNTNFMHWALKIARYVIANHQRKVQTRKRFIHLSPELLDSIAQTAQTSDLFQQDCRLDALQHCVKKLKERDGRIIQWRYEKGLSAQKIGKRLGRGGDAVYKSLSRIYQMLLICIERRLTTEDAL